MATRVVLYRDAIAELARSDQARALLQEIGDEVAKVGAGLADRRTGAGAASFYAELQDDGAEVRVAWDQLHYYMYFHEVGARHTPAHPALGPALNYIRI
jgi:hypothetical protein